ncbi:RED-like protein N-terminal region-domain-containing protein [Trametes punicea]|nr:RED-like protein N-terminal region-domain-containing protein [Trametes punicea]
MDQESFRKLLQTPKAASPTSPTASSAHVRGSLLAAAATASKDKKPKKIDASQPAFKPRQVKKGAKGEAYRDRAAERRLGIGNDYAQVEALAEEFERRHAAEEDRKTVEEQRKYLGGDSEHTVLVKGLDFALLEQARARAAAEAEATEDVSLEQAYLESTAQPKKRTREEILRELKSKRGGAGGQSAEVPAALSAADKALEEAKKAGKFKPIGFKPIGASAEKGEKVKRKKKAKAGEPEENGERKKKRKVAPSAAAAKSYAGANTSAQPAREASTPGSSRDVALNQPEAGPSRSTAEPPPAAVPHPEPPDEDFDIFADAGEYTGVDIGDISDESDEDRSESPGTKHEGREEADILGQDAPPPRKWLATSDDEHESSRGISQPPPPARSVSGKSQSRSVSPQRRAASVHKSPVPAEDGEAEDDEERPMRLQPLASSAVPSIKDLLAMSEEAEKAEKRRARKEKKKAGLGGGGGAGAEKDTKAKVERDYQRLKAYTEKKSKA